MTISKVLFIVALIVVGFAIMPSVYCHQAIASINDMELPVATRQWLNRSVLYLPIGMWFTAGIFAVMAFLAALVEAFRDPVQPRPRTGPPWTS